MTVLATPNSAGLTHNIIHHSTLATVAVWVLHLSNANDKLAKKHDSLAALFIRMKCHNVKECD